MPTTSAAPSRDPGVHLVSCDLLAPGAAERLVAETQPTHLLHLAWYTEHGSFWNSPENLAWLAASVQLVGAFTAAGGRRAVVAGSCAEYDWSGPQPCSEPATPLRPHTLYGTCKKAAVRGVIGACGPRGTLAGVGPNLPRARAAGGLCSVRSQPDPVDAYATGCPHDSRIFSGATFSTRPMSPKLCSSAGQWGDRAGQHRFRGAAPADRRGQPHRRQARCGPVLRAGELPARPDDPDALFPDVTRLSDEVGWKPRLSLAAGLDDSIAWWRAQNAAGKGA